MVGEFDYICNWLGNHAWTLSLDWHGRVAFNNAQNTTWHVGGTEAGFFQTADGFTFLKVKDAGHMVSGGWERR